MSSILAECETIPTEGNGTFSIQIPECLNSTENLVMDNLTLSLENLTYLNISSIIILPTVSEKIS